MHIELSVNAGAPPAMTVGEPGAHGAVVTGRHGIGVNTPSAAAVAAATMGLANDVHIPNGKMLTIGTLSRMFAIGGPPDSKRLTGSTFSVAGATPNEHCIAAPAQTAMPMTQPPSASVDGTADTGGGLPGWIVPASACATTDPVTEPWLGKTKTQTIVRSLSLFQPLNDGSR